MRHYLIVDDNRDFADNLAEILRDLGDEVTIAEGGREALALASSQRFDALLTDMRMPFMGGAELVHHLRSIDPGIPAMVATAHAGDNDLEAARREGLLAVLPKPVPLEQLLELFALARRDGLVAVIEDDPDQSDNLTEALRTRGFAAVTATSVLETSRLGPVRPFAALCDLRMPGGPDGEAMRRLDEKYPGLPTIVVSGVATEPPFPCAGRFEKPFETPALLAALERLYEARVPCP